MEDTPERKHFLWAVLLAWVPWVPTLIGLTNFFVGINNSKATGLAAVAGGLVELLVLWGLTAILISQVAAIVWLLRSFSTSNTLRNLIAAVSLLASGVTLLLVFAFLFWGRRILEGSAVAR